MSFQQCYYLCGCYFSVISFMKKLLQDWECGLIVSILEALGLSLAPHKLGLWFLPVIPALSRLKQEDEFKVILRYILSLSPACRRLCLKKTKQKLTVKLLTKDIFMETSCRTPYPINYPFFLILCVCVHECGCQSYMGVRN